MKMKRTVLILFHDHKIKNIKEDFIKNVAPVAHSALENELFMLIKTWVDVNTSVNILHSKEWITPSELQSLISSLDDSFTNTNQISDQHDLSSVLHKMADSLPYLGTLLSVIFIFGTTKENDLQCKSFLSIAGALKRLTEWHNAEVIINKLTSQLPATGQKLLEMGNFRLLDTLNLPSRPFLGWAGSLVLMNKCEGKGFVLPGYELECDDWVSFLQYKLSPLRCLPKKPICNTRKFVNQQISGLKQHVLGRCIEILQEVDLQTVPLFLFDKWTLILAVKDGVSSSVINYIQEMQQTGLLARLRIYNDVKEIPLCGELPNVRTEAWKERIISNYRHLIDPEEINIDPEEINIGYEYKYLYFILLPQAPPKNASHLSVMTQVLLSPYEINESIFEMFGDTRFCNSSNNSAHCPDLDLLKTKDELYIQPDKFVQLLEFFTKNPDSLKYTQDVLSSIPKEQIEPFCDKKIPYKCDDSSCIRESSMSHERRILEAKESVSINSQKYDSVQSSASRDDSDKNIDSWDFNVLDLLQRYHYLESSTPVAPIKVKGRGLCRYESHPDYSLSWPNSQHLLAPDIYYYRDENDLLFERMYAKIRDRSNDVDTGSSFISPLKKKTRKTAVISSSLRSSSCHIKGNTESKEISFSSPSLFSFTHSKHVRAPMENSDSTQENCQPSQSAVEKRPRKETGIERFKRTESLTQPLRVSPRKLALTKSASSTVLLDVESRQKNCTKNQAVMSEAQTKRSSDTKLHVALDLPSRSKSSNRDLGLTPVVQSRSRSSNRDLGLTPSVHSRSRSSNRDLGVTPAVQSGSRSSNRDLGVTPAVQSGSRSSNRDLGVTPAVQSRSRGGTKDLGKLQAIVDNVLNEKGVKKGDKIFNSCARNLFNVSLVLLKTFTSSRNLTEEMKNVVCAQVDQIISLELRRSKGR
ncbi:mdm2-binding protein isoform X2 [Biomphalaria pfeifferi]|uniref:Mdm2-binding protein isoform X2 n=1 Tax=Biomphalaria pfeifferi TaxID=112525 RepID=A0AAD8BXD5_BIOPF|nr:mdm2-binding protein isoform X2 [Biomphalaria pfeifferi]